MSQPRESQVREYFVSTVVCVIFTLFLTTFVVHPMSVPTGSMEPTILVGDRVLVDKFGFRQALVGSWIPSKLPQRGDVIVFKNPDKPQELLVKRVIGLPGEKLEIRNKEVSINGRPLNEPYKFHADSAVIRRVFSERGSGSRDNFGPVVVPANHYFVMGDNRDDSGDSRYFGFLPRTLLVGRPLVVFWSYEDPPGIHEITGFFPQLKVFAGRFFSFFSKTRWDRTLQQVE